MTSPERVTSDRAVPLPPESSIRHPEPVSPGPEHAPLEAVLLEELQDAMPGASGARVLAVARRLLHRLVSEGLVVAGQGGPLLDGRSSRPPVTTRR